MRPLTGIGRIPKCYILGRNHCTLNMSYWTLYTTWLILHTIHYLVQTATLYNTRLIQQTAHSLAHTTHWTLLASYSSLETAYCSYCTLDNTCIILHIAHYKPNTLHCTIFSSYWTLHASYCTLLASYSRLHSKELASYWTIRHTNCCILHIQHYTLVAAH